MLGLKPEPTIGGGGGAKSAAETSSPAFLHIFNCIYSVLIARSPIIVLSIFFECDTLH